jgi:soluble lytic murein transglycosylase-like protein
MIKAITRIESNFDPKALGAQTKFGKAMGLMQLMPATAKAFGVDNPFDPYQNLLGGSKYLKDLKRRYKGDIRRMLNEYSGGSSTYYSLYLQYYNQYKNGQVK